MVGPWAEPVVIEEAPPGPATVVITGSLRNAADDPTQSLATAFASPATGSAAWAGSLGNYTIELTATSGSTSATGSIQVSNTGGTNDAEWVSHSTFAISGTGAGATIAGIDALSILDDYLFGRVFLDTLAGTGAAIAVHRTRAKDAQGGGNPADRSVTTLVATQTAAGSSTPWTGSAGNYHWTLTGDAAAPIVASGVLQGSGTDSAGANANEWVDLAPWTLIGTGAAAVICASAAASPTADYKYARNKVNSITPGVNAAVKLTRTR